MNYIHTKSMQNPCKGSHKSGSKNSLLASIQLLCLVLDGILPPTSDEHYVRQEFGTSTSRKDEGYNLADEFWVNSIMMLIRLQQKRGRVGVWREWREG